MREEQKGLLGDSHDQTSPPEHYKNIRSAGKTSTFAFVLASIATIISLAGLIVVLVVFKITANRVHHTTGDYRSNRSSIRLPMPMD
jgi:hypothetical protein